LAAAFKNQVEVDEFQQINQLPCPPGTQAFPFQITNCLTKATSMDYPSWLITSRPGSCISALVGKRLPLVLRRINVTANDKQD